MERTKNPESVAKPKRKRKKDQKIEEAQARRILRDALDAREHECLADIEAVLKKHNCDLVCVPMRVQSPDDTIFAISAGAQVRAKQAQTESKITGAEG